MMIYFFADNHFEARPGYNLYEKIKNDFEIKFYEDDITQLSNPEFPDDCSLLIINMICGIGKLPVPSAVMENNVKKYCESGKPLLLLHSGSAAFAELGWWRKLTGLRWVRENDPEGLPPSVHPVRDFSVVKKVSGHALAGKLKGFELKNDEIYTKLAKTAPVEILLETATDEGVFPMAFASRNEWGGEVIGFLPGHKPASFENRDMTGDISSMIKYLLK
jgi:hypothetical protein